MAKKILQEEFEELQEVYDSLKDKYDALLEEHIKLQNKSSVITDCAMRIFPK